MRKNNIESRNENLAEPVLVAHFEEISQKPDLHPDIEGFSNIFKNDEYRKQCFEETKKAFLFVCDGDKFDNCLSAGPSEEAAKYLKRVRRYGLVLRALYIFFDESHQCPEDFQEFLSSLGKHNDKRLLKNFKKADPRDVKRFDDSNLKVNLANGRDFEKYAGETFDQINESIQEPVLSIKKFHDLRKKIRACADIMQVAAVENLGGNLHWLFASILELSVMLGKKHDGFVRKGLAGKIDYNSSMVEIDKSIVDGFQNLEPFIKKVIGLS